jgi:CHAD domain-containing protein
VKARRVKGLDCDGPLTENAMRIVKVRLGELHSFADAARDPAAVTSLHDMRIAAKRLRYVLEATTPALGPAAADGAKQAKKLQDVLGEIHDCDEFAPRVRAHIAKLRAEDQQAVRAAAAPNSKDLDPAATKNAPNRNRYRGLEALHTFISARRDVLYSSFLREWERLEGDGLGPGLLERLQGITIEQRDGND